MTGHGDRRTRGQGTSTFDVGLCADLGAFDPTTSDLGLDAFLKQADGLPDWICLMEDRQPDFFTGYRAYDPSAPVPLNRHGPNPHRWTHKDLRAFVAAAGDRGIDVLLGAWIHECRFVHDDHRELLMTGADGSIWSDAERLSADFNPMKRMREDRARDIVEGTRFADYASAQYEKLASDFGFRGLFLGDGGMGFRQFSDDDRGCAHYDYDPAWVAEFASSAHCETHEGCALRARNAPPPTLARDIHDHHWAGWLRWTNEMWTAFYATIAGTVHRSGGKLAAYNVMNFDPVAAYLHGADYRAIADAGLDYLIFQTYDYAWGPHGPFQPERKDIETNLRALLRTKAYLAGTRAKILFTAETGDSVEGWKPPLAHMLGEVYVYGHARVRDGTTWTPAADGAFIVWANHVRDHEWRALGAAFEAIARAAPPPSEDRAILWDDDHVHAHAHATKPLKAVTSYMATDRADAASHLTKAIRSRDPATRAIDPADARAPRRAPRPRPHGRS